MHVDIGKGSLHLKLQIFIPLLYCIVIYIIKLQIIVDGCIKVKITDFIRM